LCISDLFTLDVTVAKEKRSRHSLPAPSRRPVSAEFIVTLSNGRFSCSLCDKSYSVRAACASHLKFHEGNTNCPGCSKAYTSLLTMKVHMKSCSKIVPEDAKISCKICSRKMSTNYALNRHIRIVHRIDPAVVKSMDTEPVVLLKNNTGWKNQRSIKGADKLTNKKEEKIVFEKKGRFYCNKCCKLFPDKESCTIHAAMHSAKKKENRPST